jgi:hypothetical protein
MQVSRYTEMNNKPDHQVVKQEQVRVPTTDLLVHIVKPLSFYQKPEDFVPQKPLPTKYTNFYYKMMKLTKGKSREKSRVIYHIPVFVLQKAISAGSG